MREDQLIGLNTYGRSLVEGTQKVRDSITRTYLDGTVEKFHKDVDISIAESEKCGTYSGMFNQEYSLFKHTLPDGTVYEEFLQAAPWSSGPMFFLALKDKNGHTVKESLWTDEEMDKY